MNRYTVPISLFCALAAACAPAREGMEGHQAAVARAAGYSLSIEHAAELLATADSSLVPAQPTSVDVLTDLWIGYTILASELARPDTFAGIDFTLLTQFSMDQDIVWNLRQDVILADAEPSEEELRETYEQEQPFTLVEVQQIYIRVPETAGQSEVDSLKHFTDSLRERALAGEDFGELARTYSQDPSAASKGGSLGWVSRGRLVPELDAAVFKMEPGSISQTIRSALGYHIVKVTGREEPEYDEVRDEYRLQVTERSIGDLERAYVDSLRDAAHIRLAPGTVGLVRRMVYDPRLERLTPAERRAVLARFRGGALTLGEWADFVIRRAPNSKRAFSSDSATVAGYLLELVRNKLLVKAAHDLGYTLPEVKADSIKELAKRDLFAAAAVSGFRRPRLASSVQAVPDAVDTALVLVLSQQRSPAPLARVAPALTRGRPVQVYPERFPAVIDRLLELRASRAASETEGDS